MTEATPALVHTTKNDKPPMLSGRLPLLGHSLAFMRDREALFRRGFAEHGNVFAIDVGGRKTAVVTGAEHNRKVYTRTDHELDMSRPLKFARAAFGDVLAVSTRETYARQKPLLQEIFTRQRMAIYLTAMNAEARRWVDGMSDLHEAEVTGDMVELTQYVAAHAFLGPTFREELGESFWNDYRAIADAVDFVLPPNLPLPKFLRRNRAKRRLRRVMAALVARRTADPAGYDDLISLMMETPLADGTSLNEAEMAEILVALIFAGHETTAGQAAWALLSIAQHPAVLARAQQEVDAHVGDDLEITPTSLRNLQYTLMVVDETTRLYPSADLQIRHVDAPISFGPYTVPRGWRVMVNAANSHHLPSVFDHPERFDPERFERGATGSSWQNVGFGGGGHKCTGMNFARYEIAVILACVLRRFHIELVTGTPHVVRGVGANHPSPSTIRLRRRGPAPVRPATA